MNQLIKKDYLYFLFILIFLFFLGIYTFKDYGVGIDDKFHRLNGFFWLNYILDYFNFDQISETVSFKLNSISDNSLPSIEKFNFYGILFDVPAALIETFFNIDNSQDYFFLRHLLNYFYFLIGLVFLYKLLIKRFDLYSSLIGISLFILSPRIYGDSFYNMKDIIFLSFLCIALYFCFEFYKNKSFKNILFFALFSAFCIQTRILGIFLPFAFFLFYFLELLSNKNDFKYLNKYFLYLFFLFLFLYIFWPYLWSNPINNFLILFKNIEDLIPDVKVLFEGNYINVRYLPYDYIPTWIFISSPIQNSIFLILGMFLIFGRLIGRLLSFEKLNLNFYDLWRNRKEKFDLFIFFCFVSIIISIIVFNISLVNSWRYIYFLNIFIIYICTLSIYFIRKKLNKKMFKVILIFLLLSLSLTFFRMIQYHPYQGLYFNFLLSKPYKNSFDVDFIAISGRSALEWILKKDSNNLIKVASASWVPLNRSIEILDKEKRDLIKFVGQEYEKADYIYTNYISEVDKNLNKKYDIPINFIKIYDHVVDGLKVYTLYKKK